MRKRMLHLWIRAEQRKNEKRVMIAEINETIKKLMYKWKPKIYGQKIIVKMYKSI